MPVKVPWVSDLKPLKLAVMPRPEGGAMLPLALSVMREQGVEIMVSMLEPLEQEYLDLATQAAACAQAGIEYVNVPVRDRSIPKSHAQVLPVAKRLAGLLSQGRGIAFHCFAGIGRSPLMAACTLAVLGFSPTQAFNAIANARGLEVPDTDEQLAFALEFAQTLKVSGGR